MEAVGHALGQQHPGDSTTTEVLRVENDEFSCACWRVVHERDQPAVVFFGGSVASDEHRLPCTPSRSMIEFPSLAGDEIVLEGRPLGQRLRR